MIIALQALYLFQKSLLAIFEQILEPYLKNIFFYNSTDVYYEEDSDDDVYAEFDDNKGVVFFPPVYTQRYAAVSDCLLDTRWRGQLEKVIDFGCNDMSFIKCLKDIPGIREILGVDLEPITATWDLKPDRHSQTREIPLQITLYQGNAADPDYRLIGSDAVVSIEMIEHMLPHDLERFVHNIFGFIKPWVVIITTPNGDFNVLFKALEVNGLRRLDHMFEWSREQFHDWCSNIVTRYPEYSVSCKGIGPGPPGTSHLGCCSQLALFVVANYQKQRELSPESLAIVERDTGSAMTDSMDSWEMTESGLDNSVESLTIYKYETVSFIMSQPSLLIQHKNIQCNIKDDMERNYLMFDEDTFHIRLTGEQYISVYHIENVENRLNCTSNQVKRFSNTTHQLMAKNKLDSLVNTRDVVTEIRHLSKIANLNTQESTWKNINWGEDAPYWNKYYKIIKEYSYPFAAKSDETRILEVISEEVSRLIYSSSEEHFLQDDKMEIPIQYIMGVVRHITDDEDKVRELLEWNGYEVIGDMVVYTKLIADDLPEDIQRDWIDVDSASDWVSTESKSLVILNNVSESDMLEYDLRVSVNQKLHMLQEVSKRKDVSCELEQLVCRLVDLVQDIWKFELLPLHRLCDLLTVTEKLVMKQRKNFIGDCKRAIRFSKSYKEDKNEIICIGIQKACRAERYDNILLDSDQSIEQIKYDCSNESLSICRSRNMSSDITENKEVLHNYDGLMEELELREINYKGIKKADIATCTDTEIICVDKKINEINKNTSAHGASNHFQVNNDTDEEVIVIKAKPTGERLNKIGKRDNKTKSKKYKKFRKFRPFATGYINYFKNVTIKHHHQKVKLHRQLNYNAPIYKSIKPIPSSLMNLFNSSQSKIEVTQESSIGDIEFSDQDSLTVKYQQEVTGTIDTTPRILDKSKKKDLERKVVKNVSNYTETNNVQEEFRNAIVYLDDINEPSSSDGIRHISADVQCGADDTINMLPKRSVICVSKITPKQTTNINKDFNIQASYSDFQNTVGTCTNNDSVDNCDLFFTKEHVFDYLKHEENGEYKSHQKRKAKTESVYKNQEALYHSTAEIKANNKRSSLSCGGIYVHCYKNNKSEDIVYQGKWQKCISKNVAKKTPIILYKKRKEIVVKKKNVNVEKDSLNISDVNNRLHKKKISYRNLMIINTAHRKTETHCSLDTRNVKKKSKNVQIFKPSVGMRPLETSTPVTKLFDTNRVLDINNYIPAYLKRRMYKNPTRKEVNINLNIVLNTINKSEPLDKLHKNNARDAKTVRCKRYRQRVPTYQVYRNEIDKDNINLRGSDNEILKKRLSASSGTRVPSCSNNVHLRTTDYSICSSTKISSLNNNKPQNYKNNIKGNREMNSVKTIVTKNIENTTRSPRRVPDRYSGQSNGVQLTKTSIDHSFSNNISLNPKYVNIPLNTDSAYNSQTTENAYLMFNNDAEKNNEDIQIYTDINIEDEMKCLIDESLGHIEMFSSVDNKQVYHLHGEAYEKKPFNTDFVNTFTTPMSSSAAKSEIFARVQEEKASIVSNEYSNIDSGVQDVELLSPISVPSVNTSKFSEYLSADNEFEESLNSNSIFSLPQNLFDASMNMSNPLQVSQRSSEDTYMSCSTDDDRQIPYWLFESDSEPERLVTSLPLEEERDETQYTEDETQDTEDEVQSEMEGDLQAIDFGAGDGRGIHSDISRDTSGRGTSLSSGMTSLESQETLSNPSMQQSVYYRQTQDCRENGESFNEPMEAIDTPNDTGEDTRSIDNE